MAITTNFEALVTAKENLRQAINAKGGDLEENAKLAEFAEVVEFLEVGGGDETSEGEEETCHAKTILNINANGLCEAIGGTQVRAEMGSGNWQFPADRIVHRFDNNPNSFGLITVDGTPKVYDKIVDGQFRRETTGFNEYWTGYLDNTSIETNAIIRNYAKLEPYGELVVTIPSQNRTMVMRVWLDVNKLNQATGNDNYQYKMPMAIKLSGNSTSAREHSYIIENEITNRNDPQYYRTFQAEGGTCQPWLADIPENSIVRTSDYSTMFVTDLGVFIPGTVQNSINGQVLWHKPITLSNIAQIAQLYGGDQGFLVLTKNGRLTALCANHVEQYRYQTTSYYVSDKAFKFIAPKYAIDKRGELFMIERKSYPNCDNYCVMYVATVSVYPKMTGWQVIGYGDVEKKIRYGINNGELYRIEACRATKVDTQITNWTHVAGAVNPNSSEDYGGWGGTDKWYCYGIADGKLYAICPSQGWDGPVSEVITQVGTNSDYIAIYGDSRVHEWQDEQYDEATGNFIYEDKNEIYPAFAVRGVAPVETEDEDTTEQ